MANFLLGLSLTILILAVIVFSIYKTVDKFFAQEWQARRDWWRRRFNSERFDHRGFEDRSFSNLRSTFVDVDVMSSDEDNSDDEIRVNYCNYIKSQILKSL